MASLPPSSMTSGMRCWAAWAATLRAVALEPVNETMSTPESIRALPVSAAPWTTSTAPGGKPASVTSSAISSPECGVTSEGFSTTVHPAARAVTVGWNGSRNG